MFAEIKRFTVKKGFADQIMNKFQGSKAVEAMEGFVDLSVMKSIKNADTEEVMVELRWENQEAYKNWKKSDTHKAGHTGGQKEKPEYMLDVKLELYSTAE